MNKQLKSRKRIADHGEVFTSDREVNEMLSLVKHETERIDSRFLEPACGTGNFLVEVLKRKLAIVKLKYKRSQYEYERYGLLAITSIYGVDLLLDNINECRERLYKVYEEEYKLIYKTKTNKDFLDIIKFVLIKNIQCGDALTMISNDGKPIIFSEWSLLNGSMIKRRDFTFNELLSCSPLDVTSDTDKQVYIPNPIKEYPIINYMRLKEYE